MNLQTQSLRNIQSGSGRNVWAAAIIASREPLHVLMATLAAAANAAGGEKTTIDIIVNGNDVLAREAGAVILKEYAKNTGVKVRAWHIKAGDKAHAWNRYLQDIWPGSAVAFFIDGYARVRPDSFRLMAEGLRITPSALGASGVPSLGWSARGLQEKMQKSGGLHGNLFALRGETMSRLRACGFHIPRSLYRTDSLLGAVINFNLDPKSNAWDPRRILVLPEVSWDFDPLDWKNPTHIKTQWKRIMRQAQGDLENAAVKSHMAIHKRPPEALPDTAQELVVSWWEANRRQAYLKCLRKPLRLWAFRRMWKTAPLPDIDALPKLICETVAYSES